MTLWWARCLTNLTSFKWSHVAGFILHFKNSQYSAKATWAASRYMCVMSFTMDWEAAYTLPLSIKLLRFILRRYNTSIFHALDAREHRAQWKCVVHHRQWYVSGIKKYVYSSWKFMTSVCTKSPGSPDLLLFFIFHSCENGKGVINMFSVAVQRDAVIMKLIWLLRPVPSVWHSLEAVRVEFLVSGVEWGALKQILAEGKGEPYLTHNCLFM